MTKLAETAGVVSIATTGGHSAMAPGAGYIPVPDRGMIQKRKGGNDSKKKIRALPFFCAENVKTCSSHDFSLFRNLFF